MSLARSRASEHGLYSLGHADLVFRLNVAPLRDVR